jgi:plasmid stabilization system protein ParE
VRGLERCRFLAATNPQAAKRAAQAIEHQFALLETIPDIGSPFSEFPDGANS